MNTAEILVKTLHGKRLSPDEKIHLLIGLVSEKTQMLVTQEILALTHRSKSQVLFQLIAPMFTQNTNQITKFRV